MLKATLENLDGLDEALKPLYSETDGKFVLQVEGMETADSVNNLKTALVKERERNSQFKKFGTPEEITARFNKLEKSAAKIDDKTADQQAIIDQMKSEHAAAMQAQDAKFIDAYKTTAVATLKAELAKSGVLPDAIDYAANGLAARLRIDPDGTQTILSSDGKTPMIGGAANGGATFADLTKELQTSQPFIFTDNGKAGGGKPPNTHGGKPDTPTMPLAEFSALPPKERAEKMAAGLTLTE